MSKWIETQKNWWAITGPYRKTKGGLTRPRNATVKITRIGSDYYVTGTVMHGNTLIKRRTLESKSEKTAMRHARKLKTMMGRSL